MKLKNKNTGEIALFENAVDIHDKLVVSTKEGFKYYDSLAELNADWEDYEESKGSALDLMILTLTNFIENEPDEDKIDLEECNQMLEKLKAWKRLKDTGFRFVLCDDRVENGKLFIVAKMPILDIKESQDDLDLLFGGEE